MIRVKAFLLTCVIVLTRIQIGLQTSHASKKNLLLSDVDNYFSLVVKSLSFYFDQLSDSKK